MFNNQRLLRISILTAWACLLALPSPALAQDALTRAKGLYESADYEQALQLLETLKGKTSNNEAAAYQMFCLVALGRRDEARAAVEAIVRTDPLFKPSEAQVSPRIRSFFDDVRKPLLPEIVKVSYAKAKAAFDLKDWPTALVEFDRVIALIDETGGSDPGKADLRTLASGFRDLAKTASQPPPPPPAPVTPEPAKPAAPPPDRIYGDEDPNIVRPVAIAKRIPDWRPNTVEARMEFNGQIEVLISEQGKVLSATIIKSINPRYDGPLLEAAKTWTFQPAVKNGVPVKYRYSVAIRLSGSK